MVYRVNAEENNKTEEETIMPVLFRCVVRGSFPALDVWEK